MTGVSASSTRLRRCLLALAAGLLAVLAGATGLGNRLDDAFHRAVSPLRTQASAAPVAVLEIDRLETWSSSRIAELLSRLRAAGVRGIALELPLDAMTGVDPGGDARLARTLLDDRIVLGVAMLPQADGSLRAVLPPTEFADAARLGHAFLPRDADGRIRNHMPHVLGADGIRWPSLALALALPGGYGGNNGQAPPARWRIPYPEPAGAPPGLRAADLLPDRIAASRLRGHWVLVGLTDPARVARTPGPHGSAALFPVEHQARGLVALLQGTPARTLPPLAQALLALLLATAAVLAGMARGGRDWRMPAALLAGIAATLALSAGLLARHLWFAPGGILGVLGLALLAWAALALRQRVHARRPLPGLATPGRLQAALQAARAAGTPHALLVLQAGTDEAPRDARASHGEDLTCRIAQLLGARARRPGDVATHLGAGRFALLLPDTSVAAAEHILEDIRRQLAGQPHATAVEGSVHACGERSCDCQPLLSTRMPLPATAHPRVR